MSKFFIDNNGKYLGVFSGITPEGGIEVDTYPSDARQKWDGSKWLELDSKLTAIDAIQNLEALLTPRRLRESARAGLPVIVDGVDVIKEIERLETQTLGR